MVGHNLKLPPYSIFRLRTFSASFYRVRTEVSSVYLCAFFRARDRCRCRECESCLVSFQRLQNQWEERRGKEESAARKIELRPHAASWFCHEAISRRWEGRNDTVFVHPWHCLASLTDMYIWTSQLNVNGWVYRPNYVQGSKVLKTFLYSQTLKSEEMEKI